MDLPDRCRSEGTLIEVGEDTGEWAAELLAQELLQARERDRRDAVTECRELLLKLGLLLLGEAIEIDHRDDLADLHRRTAHATQLIDDFMHERCRALLLCGGCALGRAHTVGGSHPGPAHSLSRRQPAHSRRPRDAAGGQFLGLRSRQLLRLGSRILVGRHDTPRLAGALGWHSCLR